MQLISLLYVSRATIAPAQAATSVKNIVETATARNPGLGLTGALLFTGEYFAQVLEGSEASIDFLMADICRDPRHEQLMIADRGPIAERRFPDWSMAYFGPSQFVSRHVTRLLGDCSLSERDRASGWLADLMWQFTAGAGKT